MIQLSSIARRVDEPGRFFEEAGIRPDEWGVFEVTYVPDGGARLGVVICSPILMEQSKTYRHEVLLARSLAARGIAVQRIHYRGTGHSGGDDAEVTHETMVEDTLAAAKRFVARTGVRRLGFVGTRWGALVAGAAIRRYPHGPLVLWEPVVDGAQYFRELVRARLVRELRLGHPTGASANTWQQELEQHGWTDILGYALHRPLLRSAQGVRLSQLLEGCVDQVLLVQFVRHGKPRSDMAQLAERLSARSGKVDVRSVNDEPAWNFTEYPMKSVGELVNLTVDWLAAADAMPSR